MKKAGIILFSVFYFIVACGFAFNLHYCAGKFKGISLIQTAENGCCGSKKKSKGCCDNKTHVFKIKDTQQASVKIASLQPFDHLLFTAPSFLFCITDGPAMDLYLVPDSNAPPFGNPDPIYLLNQNFRI